MSKTNINDFICSKKGYAISGILIGAVIFMLIYGIDTLAPTNVSFLYNGGDKDVMSHQFGFDFYRFSSWMHPIGMTDAYPYPYLSSVINSDSIPLIAIPLKIISPFLPKSFQYFGFWIFFCFIMQGLSAALLLKRLRVDYAVTVSAIPFFIINVPLLFRCFHHSSLAGQWLILLGFLLILESNCLSLKKQALFWCLLCGISVWIHGYLFIIMGTMMTLYCIYFFIKKKKIKEVCLIFFPCVVVSLFLYYEGGGYLSNTSVEMFGLGTFTLDLTDYFNPGSFSTFFSQIDSSIVMENSMYCGLGILIMLIVALTIFYLCRKEYANAVKNNRLEVYSVIGGAVVFVCIALGVRGRFAGISFYDLRPLLDQNMTVFLSGFRASARFFWPVWYLILLVAVSMIGYYKKHNKAVVALLLVCMILQYVDIVPKTAKGGAAGFVNGYESVRGNAFEGVFTDAAKHMSFLGVSYNVDDMVFAAHHNMTSNFSNVGRGKKNSVQADTDDFNAGNLRADTIYVVNINCLNYIYPVSLPDDYIVYFCDEFVYIFSKKLMQNQPGGDAVVVEKQSLADAAEQVFYALGEPEPIPAWEDR